MQIEVPGTEMLYPDGCHGQRHLGDFFMTEVLHCGMHSADRYQNISGFLFPLSDFFYHMSETHSRLQSSVPEP